MKTGAPKACTRPRAQIWLRVDQGPQGPADTDRAAAALLAISHETVVRARQAWVQEGMAQALRPKPLDHPRRPRRLDGVGEAELVKLAWRAGAGPPGALDPGFAGCPVDGTASGRLDRQGDGASDSTRNELQPWRPETWCLKSAPDADFVCALEEVLDTYQRPVDPRHPVVCVAELSQTLHAHVRSPHPPRAGQVARQDYASQRHGHCNLCMMTAPCLGWRTVKVTSHRKRQHFAAILKELVDVHFSAADHITLVCDNLNIHQPSVLYD